MASGVLIDDDCKNVFAKDMKMDKLHRYVVFALSPDMKKICIEKKASPEATYEDFVTDMVEIEAKKECRYVVFDLHYQSEQGSNKTKLVFFSWAPDTAKIKYKMVHASSKDALKKALGEGIGKEIQASDQSDLQWSDVLKEVRLHDRH